MEKKTVYLIICENCAMPEVIPKYIIRNYFPILSYKNYWCGYCGFEHVIPEHLKRIAQEL